jgi:hypothetical protein
MISSYDYHIVPNSGIKSGHLACRLPSGLGHSERSRRAHRKRPFDSSDSRGCKAPVKAHRKAPRKARRKVPSRACSRACLKAPFKARFKAHFRAHSKAPRKAQFKARGKARRRVRFKARSQAQLKARVKAQFKARFKPRSRPRSKAAQGAVPPPWGGRENCGSGCARPLHMDVASPWPTSHSAGCRRSRLASRSHTRHSHRD